MTAPRTHTTAPVLCLRQKGFLFRSSAIRVHSLHKKPFSLAENNISRNGPQPAHNRERQGTGDERLKRGSPAGARRCPSVAEFPHQKEPRPSGRRDHTKNNAFPRKKIRKNRSCRICGNGFAFGCRQSLCGARYAAVRPLRSVMARASSFSLSIRLRAAA